MKTPWLAVLIVGIAMVLGGSASVAAGGGGLQPFGAPLGAGNAVIGLVEDPPAPDGDGDDCAYVCPQVASPGRPLLQVPLSVGEDLGDDAAALRAQLEARLERVRAAVEQDGRTVQGALAGPVFERVLFAPPAPTRFDPSVNVTVAMSDVNGVGGGTLWYEHAQDETALGRVDFVPAADGTWYAHLPGPFAEGDDYTLWIYAWDASWVGISLAASFDTLSGGWLIPPPPGASLSATFEFEVADTTPPTIQADETPTEALAGGSLEFEVWVADAGGAVSVRVVARYAGSNTAPEGAPTTIHLVPGPILGRFAATVQLQPTIRPLRYHVEAIDEAGNWAGGPPRVVTLRDPEQPHVELVDLPQRVRAGSLTAFRAHATDNLAIAAVDLVTETPGHGPERLRMSAQGGEWVATAYVHADVDRLAVVAVAYDTGGLSAATMTSVLAVEGGASSGDGRHSGSTPGRSGPAHDTPTLPMVGLLLALGLATWVARRE